MGYEHEPLQPRWFRIDIFGSKIYVWKKNPIMVQVRLCLWGPSKNLIIELTSDPRSDRWAKKKLFIFLFLLYSNEHVKRNKTLKLAWLQWYTLSRGHWNHSSILHLSAGIWLLVRRSSSYRVFIKYCVFFEDFKIFRILFFSVVSVCTHTRQVENQRCCRTGRVQKNHKILRKKHNI